WAGEGIARTGQDHHPILRVGAHVTERPRELLVRQQTPLQRPAVGVHGQLQNAIAPLHANRLVALGVVLQPGQRWPPWTCDVASIAGRILAVRIGTTRHPAREPALRPAGRYRCYAPQPSRPPSGTILRHDYTSAACVVGATLPLTSISRLGGAASR